MSSLTDKAPGIPAAIAATTTTGKHKIHDTIEQRRRAMTRPARRKGRMQGIGLTLIIGGIAYRYRTLIAPYFAGLTGRAKSGMHEVAEEARDTAIDLRDKTTTPPSHTASTPSGTTTPASAT